MRSELFIIGITFICTVVHAQPLQKGGGEYVVQKSVCVSSEQYASIYSELDKRMFELKQKGVLPQVFSPTITLFDFPLKQSPGFNYPSFYGVSNYVDHNTGFPNQITDFNCGNRSYDTDGGYNHQGIDYFLWPFDHLMQDRDQVQIVAAADGIILFKSEGNSDQSCSFCSGCMWNAVYLVHPDGAVTWYGHMKKNSVTAKAEGQPVVKGEYLGIVGSSGNSTGPHLHFEIYKAQPYSRANLIDAYAGPCNSLNGTTSWWQNQLPYQNPTINRIQTQTAPPNFPVCPAIETTYESNQFVQGQTVFYASYFADQLAGTTATYTVTYPDNAVFQTWTQTFANTFAASWWWWSFTLPSSTQIGTWNFRVTYNNQTVNYPFVVTAATSVQNITENIFEMKVYPNPFVQQLTINSTEVLKKPVFTIYDSKGAAVYRVAMHSTHQKEFQLNNLQLGKGTYLLVVTENNRAVFRKMISK